MQRVVFDIQRWHRGQVFHVLFYLYEILHKTQTEAPRLSIYGTTEIMLIKFAKGFYTDIMLKVDGRI
jgi:hypothetical protein